MTVENNFSFSYADEYTQLLTELHSDYCRDQPEDVLQYCANFFNRKLEEQRVMLREQQRGEPMFQGKLYIYIYIYIYVFITIHLYLFLSNGLCVYVATGIYWCWGKKKKKKRNKNQRGSLKMKYFFGTYYIYKHVYTCYIYIEQK